MQSGRINFRPIDTVFEKIGHFVIKYPKQIIFVFFILALISLYGIRHLSLDHNIYSLLPEDIPELKDFLEFSELAGINDQLVILLEMKDHSFQPLSKSFLEELAEKLKASDMIDFVEYKKSGIRDILIQNWRFLFDRFYVFLPPSQLDLFIKKLSPQNIKEQIKKNRDLMFSPMGIGVQRKILKDPLDFSELFMNQSNERTSSVASLFKSSDEDYFQSEDGLYLFMVAKPVQAMGDINFDRKLMSSVIEAEQKAKEDFCKKNNLALEEFQENIQIGYTGSYAIAYEEGRAIRKDMLMTILISFFCVLFLFWLIFHEIKFLIFLAIPLIFSLLFTNLAAYLLFGKLNIITFGYAAILLGLGIDFAIHLLNRYYIEFKKESDNFLAMKSAIINVGQGILLGALTTSIAFLMLSLSGFKGIAQLGIIVGLGLIISMICVIFLFPSLILFFNCSPPKRLWFSGLMDKIARFLEKNYASLFIVNLTVFCVCCLLLVFFWRNKTWFDKDLHNLQSKKRESFLVQEKILKHFGNHLEPINVLIESDTIQHLIQKAYLVHNKIKHLEDSSKITKYEDIFQFLPSPVQQREIKRSLHQIDFKSTINAVNKALIENQFNPRAFHEFFNWLNQLEASIKDPEQIISPVDFWNELPGIRPILRRYFFPSSERLYSFAYFYPTHRITEPHEIQKIRDYFKGGHDGIKVSGVSFLPYKLFRTIMDEERHIIILAFLSLIVLLGLAYRRLSLVIFSFFPLIAGMVFLISVMPLLGLRFNFVNVITLPLILGIGIDDSIHILIRFQDKKNIFGTISETAAAVILTTLTTIAGFGSMVLGNHEGMISLGWIIIIGLLSCLYTSLFVLPPALKIFCRFSPGPPEY